MDIEKAERYLNETSIFTRRFLHSSALKYLSETDEPEAMDILTKAIETHRRAPEIKEIVLRVEDAEKIDRLWQIWSETRGKALGQALREKKTPASHGKSMVLSLLKTGASKKILGILEKQTAEKRSRIASRIVGFFRDTDEDIRKEVLRFISIMPNEAAFNEHVSILWAESGDDALLRVIRKQNRLPESADLEGLYYLASGDFDAYARLHEKEEGLLERIWKRACQKLKSTLNERIARSGNVDLLTAYNRALAAKEDFDFERYAKELAAAGNEEGLFDASRHMVLPGLLELCERWAKNGWLPDDDRRRKAVSKAVGAFVKVGKVSFEQGEKLPAGVSDLFEYWERRNPTDAELRSGLTSDDPFERLKSIYLGFPRGLTDREASKRASESKHWPDRLAARLSAPELAEVSRTDHVQWLNMLFDTDTAILNSKPGCTPDELNRFRAALEREEKNGSDGLKRGLLQVLVSFQEYFSGTAVTATKEDTAPYSTAIGATKDAPAEDELTF